MKNVPLIFLLLILTATGCAISAQQGHATYLAPVFTDTARETRIRKVLPEIDALFRDFAATNKVPGFAYGVVLDNRLIHSGAGGTINLGSGQKAGTSSLFRIASMTKSFTAMAIVQLRDAGKLALTDPVHKYLPELNNTPSLTSDAPPPTIHNLLTMTAGFPEDNPWGDRQLEDTDEEFLEFLRGGIAFSTTPASGYEYSNLGYAMLGRIITQVSGVPYQQYIRENIFKPLGMEHTHWEYAGLPADLLALGYRWEDEQWKPEPMLHDGAYGAMGGLITSIEDFSKYLAFHLAAWPPSNASETGPLRRNSVREMHRMTEPRLNAEARDAQGAPCPQMLAYGYGLRIQKDCKGVIQIAHSGGLPGFGSNFSFYPDYGLGIILFANRTYAPTAAANAQALQLLLRKADLQPRKLPASAILTKRQQQVAQLIQTWDEKLGNEILAENFYPDRDRDHRREEAQKLLKEAGKILHTGDLIPENQLRGVFRLHGAYKDIEVFFSLSPEKDPKVQALTLRLVDKK